MKSLELIMKNSFTTHKSIVIAFVLLIAVASFIFYMSSRDVDESMTNSMPFDRFVASVLVDGYDEMTPEEQNLAALAYDEPIRHVAHAAEFFVLGALLALLCYMLAVPVWVGLLAGAGYGVFDEIHQLFVAGRGCQLSDIGFDVCGVVIGVIIVTVICKCFRKTMYLKK